jgi:hypothetical protein
MLKGGRQQEIGGEALGFFPGLATLTDTSWLGTVSVTRATLSYLNSYLPDDVAARAADGPALFEPVAYGIIEMTALDQSMPRSLAQRFMR